MWFIRVEVEQETSAPPPKKHPGSAPENIIITLVYQANLSLLLLSLSASEKQFNTLSKKLTELTLSFLWFIVVL